MLTNDALHTIREMVAYHYQTNTENTLEQHTKTMTLMLNHVIERINYSIETRLKKALEAYESNRPAYLSDADWSAQKLKFATALNEKLVIEFKEALLRINPADVAASQATFGLGKR